MAVKINKWSMLRFSILRSVDGIEFWDLPVLPEIPETNQDISKRVQRYARTDQVGWGAYREEYLGWVLHAANDHFFPPRDMAPGDVVRFPPGDLLKPFLESKMAEMARKRK